MPSAFRMARASMYVFWTKGYSAIFPDKVYVTPPPKMSSAPHIRLKYVKASLTHSGSKASLPTIRGVYVATMWTNPMSMTPMDKALVMVVLLNISIRFFIQWFIASPIQGELFELLIDYQFKEETCNLTNQPRIAFRTSKPLCF